MALTKAEAQKLVYKIRKNSSIKANCGTKQINASFSPRDQLMRDERAIRGRRILRECLKSFGF